ncbi:hypothetical protein [Kineococcus gypseus]|uniref:hypothetical protein n=1 Tax=Kineococcus gypseus TaxID=1637102 RepID=UPI003D7CC21A
MSPYGPRVSIASVLAAEAYVNTRVPAPAVPAVPAPRVPAEAERVTAPAATATAVLDAPAGSRSRLLALLRPARRGA